MDQEISNKRINILRSLNFLLLYASFSFSQLYAQTEKLKEGDRVRISAPTVESKKIRGTVTSFSSDTLLVSFDNTALFVPNRSIEKLEISTGKKRNTSKGAIIGAISGGLFLGIISVATNKPCKEGEWCFIEMSDAEAFGFGTFAGALGGAFNGAIIGSFIKTDRWNEVPIGISMRLSPSSDTYLSIEPVISVRFKF